MTPGGNMKKGLLALAVLLILPAYAAYAEMMYITDKIEASVRSGKGLAAGSKYLAVVRTGDKVDVLETDGEYVRVKLANGTEGWVHTRYITATAPKTLQPGSPAADTAPQKEKNKNP